jgi:predicted DNA-binding transcriptional regulator AlpA
MTDLTTSPLLRQGDLLRLLGISRSTLWCWRRSGWFPPGIKISQRGDLAWFRSEVEDWLGKLSNQGLLRAASTSSEDPAAAHPTASGEATSRVQIRVQNRVQEAPHSSERSRTALNTKTALRFAANATA